MTRLRRRYHGQVVNAMALTRGVPVFHKLVDPMRATSTLRVERRHETWDLDTIDDFLNQYEKGATRALIECRAAEDLLRIRINHGTAVLTVRMASLAAVEGVVAAIDAASGTPPFRIFIGHGRAAEWQMLAEHLRDQHKFSVMTYETLAWLGEPATEVLERAVSLASAAILVHSPEVLSTGEQWYPSANVAHETGFFSARLGLHRAIVVRNDRCISFTNIAGLTHLRYADRDIHETFDDVVAALRRLQKAPYLPNAWRG